MARSLRNRLVSKLLTLRNRLLVTFLVLVVVVGAGTLYAIERTLADDLLSGLDTRLSLQGRAVASWLTKADHPDRLALRLADVTGTQLTIIGADGLVQGDSLEPSTVGRPIGEAWEVYKARHGEVGRAQRQLHDDGPEQYLVAVPAEQGRVIRLAVPVDDIIDTRARMRNRLLVGFGLGFVGALLLSWIFIRAITRPIQSMTRAAEQLAAGNYDGPAPAAATDAGGELGVLARAMMHMAGEVKSRVGELTEQRDLLSVVVGGLVEGVVVVEHGGKIALVNDIAKPLVGDTLPASLMPLVERAQNGAQADEELELVGRTVRASARPLGTDAAIIVLYDVTRMRALESVRREFLSNAAHELRTPVTSISGYAETLLGGGVDSDTSKEFLTTIHRNAQRIAGLVSDLLVLDQLGSRAATVGERIPVALDQVISDAARTTKGITPSAQIIVEVSADASVLGTREGLDHVVQNLIDNAVKYGGGTPVMVRAERVGRFVRLTVSDAGPGIPRGQEERIFERFYRIDPGRSRNQGGSGLGLAIVRSQLEAMGGRVWVEHANPGARFIVELEAA
ncbi:MAG: putative Phosphate regulon sensor histidine kinase PhoR [Myxococcales bacterium]|nr:putative Phosphate regulon sensor histidine kinase PhoR [Myxococcales bacterium]